jgi:hypothetical protein
MSADSPKDNGIKGFWMELMNLPGFSESSDELGAIGIIPVLVPGHVLRHLWMLVYIAGTKGIIIGFRMDTTGN